MTAYERLSRWLGRHTYFILALAAGIWALWSVPQVKRLWHQLPPIERWQLWVLNLLFLAALMWSYVPSWFIVASEFATPGRARNRRHKLFEILRAMVCAPSQFASWWLPAATLKLPRPLRLFPALILLVLAIWIFAQGGLGHESRLYPLAGSICRYVGVVSLPVSLWLLWATRHEHPGPAWVITGRALGWLIVYSLIGEVVWIFAAYGWLAVTYRMFSVWALFHLFSALMVTGSLIDYSIAHSTWPVRPVVFLIVVALIGGQRPQPVKELGSKNERKLAAVSRSSNGEPDGSKEDSLRPDWYEYALERLQNMPDGPVIIVAASGGGSRAAIFTSLVLEELSRPAGSSDATGARVSGDTWATNIWLISSVSGGSLATADYIARGCPRPSRVPANIDARELVILMKEHLQGVLKNDNPEKPLPPTVRESVKAALLHVDGIESRASTYEWLLESPFVDDMSTDFMAPILRGLYTPALSRGDSLAHFWNERFKWTDISMSSWNKGNETFGPKSRPLMILNACDIDRGARLAVGFPPLPETLLREDAKKLRPLGTGEPAGLTDLEQGVACNLTLARAVRLSSNFPWGFPVSEFNEKSQPTLSKPLRVLDGGVIDNTGIDSIYYLIRGLVRTAASDSTHVAGSILKQLRDRGLVLIEVDSGARPVDKHNIDFFAGVTKPLQALNNAVYSNAEQTKHFYIDRITQLVSQVELSTATSGLDEEELKRLRVYLAGLQSSLPPLVFHHRFRCNHIEDNRADVMTAWALGPEDEGIIMGQFLTTLRDWQEFRNDVPIRFGAVHKAIADARKSADLLFAEYQMLALLESFRENDRLLREIVTLKNENASFEEIFKIRDELLKNFDQQDETLKSIAAKFENVPNAAEYQENVAALQEQLSQDIGQLADAKDISVELVQSMLKRNKATDNKVALSELTRETAGAIRQQSQQAVQETVSSKQSAIEFQKEFANRSHSTERFYEQIQQRRPRAKM